MTPRQHLAEAKIALRAAKDTLETAKIVATLDVAGKNPEERKANAAIALHNNRPYSIALAHVRACEAILERAESAIAEQEHELRVREVAAREGLAKALMGRRVDDGAADRACTCDECIAAIDSSNHIKAAQQYQEPIFPAGSNAGEYYPNDWYKQNIY